MLISLDWLKEFVEIPKSLDPKDLGDMLTLKTAEVEKVVSEAENFENMVTGHVVELQKHPDADKLKVAKVSVGKETLQIVCGGANLKEGMYVAVTKIGSKVKWHGEGELVELKRTKIRGVESEGMIAAGNEMGIDDPNAGPEDIMDLSAIKPDPGTPLAEIFGKNDIVLEFDNKSLTHRPDLWGHYGIAREIAAITDSKLKPYKPSPKIPEKGESPKVEVKDKELCPRFCALTIDNIKVEESPEWLKKRLRAIGHGVHNNIVDITNYVMAEIGHPMHAFDKEIVKDGIVIRTAKKGEKLTTLDGKEYKLDESIGVVANTKEAHSVAGIIGGKDSGITEKTTSIVLEAANWHPARLRRTSMKIGVRTDAVQRFEKSLDPNLSEYAIRRAAELVLELCPNAKIAGPMTDVKNFNEKPIKVTLDVDKASSKIGAEIKPADAKKILEKLEFKVKEKGGKTFEVTVPTFRATKDVSIEDDLIEELSRMYGYDNITPSLPSLPTKLPMDNTERFKKHRARELFSHGLGFDEVYNYSFYGKTEIENCLLQEEGHLKVLNYLSEDQTHMRTSMTPNILKNLQLNAKYFSEVKIYEIGRTYKEIGDYMPLEEKKIVGAIMVKGKTDEPFYEAKGAIDAFVKKFNLPKLKSAKGIKATPYAHPQKAISYLDPNGQTLGKVFMLHPTVSKNHDLDDYSIAILAINFSEALKLDQPTRKFRALPKFPNIDIDISVVVDKNTEVGSLKSSIKNADQNLISSIELFDIYEGENIEKNKKSVAFTITLQSKDRTLTDEEMIEVQKRIFKNLEKLGGKIRGKA